MKGKVVLIQPKNTLAINIYPPLNLVKIGSALQANGFEVKIIAAPILKQARKVILDECRDALMVGIGILTAEVPDAIGIAREIKKAFNLPIVWGGWHATLFPEQMAESSLVDKVIVDEGDELIVEAAEFYLKNKGAVGNDNNKILRNKSRIQLDSLPEPDYSLVPGIEHFINVPLTDKFLEYDDRAIRWLPYEASRGCPSRCTFCINIVTGNNVYRRKSAKKVVDEIVSLTNKYNLNHLKIIDDNMFVDVKWVKDIACGLIDNNLAITWDAECRVDYFSDSHVNDECLELCVKSGMNELNFGIESGSEHTLELMKKGITPEQAIYAVESSSRHGIVSRCSFIIDIPGERESDIFKTVKLVNRIREIPKTTCGVHTYRPYPKSELCEGLLKSGVIKQPEDFEGWADNKFIEQFTYTDAKRSWQKNSKISSKISFYQCLESGVWLKPHQIKSKTISAANNFFIKLAYLRNRNIFYKYAIDRYLYKIFKNFYYKYNEWR